jgi:hypothetical protein
MIISEEKFLNWQMKFNWFDYNYYEEKDDKFHFNIIN